MLAERRRCSGACRSVEDVGLGVDRQRRIRQAESARQPADRDDQRRRVRVFGAFGRRRDDLVVARDLQHPLGAARRGGDKHHKFLPLARPPDFGDPILHAAAELDDRLAGDMPRSRLAAARRAEREFGRITLDAQLLEPNRAGQACAHGVAVQEQPLRRRHRPRRRAARRPGLAGQRLVTRRSLLEEGVDGLEHLVGLGDDEDGAPAEGQVLENRGLQPQVRGRRIVGLAQAFANGHDACLVHGPRRALRGWVIAADGFDRVADELDAQWLGVARGEHVHDAPAHAELAVLVDRVFAGESGFDQLLGEQQWSDVDARGQVHRCRRQLGGRHQPRQQRRRRDHDRARLARDDLGEGTRACGGDLQVRRQTAIGIDLVTGQRRNGIGHRGFS